MELTNEFTVELPIERAWLVLTDVERIAPCMPGARLTGVDGDTYTGEVVVKLGPVTTHYKGTAAFDLLDEGKRIAVLRARGRDARGQGTASALITATLSGDGERTKVEVHTDLTITGKVAQFGRGVIADVSAKLLGQFVDCLEASLVETPAVPQASAADTTVSADGVSRPPERRSVTPLDLAAIARGPVLARALPVLVVVVLAAVIGWLVRRRG